MDQLTQSFQQAQFIFRYLKNELTAQEKIALDTWLAESVNNQTLFEELTDDVLLKKELAFFNEVSKDTAWQKIDARLEEPGKIIHLKTTYRWWYVAAAVIALLGAFGMYQFNFQKKEQVVISKTSIENNDIAPGGNIATLTLADGSTISLDSANNGSLAQQGQSTIVKLEDGQLAYEQDGRNTASIAIQYNTVSTPRGGQYQLVLSDGSKVWLNAESSIRFPASFTGKERNVEITGEAYFEVAHNASKPFIVSVNSVAIKVLGTSFNVNAYDDEQSMKTTLLNGSVEISTNRMNSKLKPGEQADILNKSENIRIIQNANIEKVTAWKNGFFLFNEDSIEDVMKIIGRWYDIEVEINGTMSKEKFNGKLYRDVNISQIIQILEEGGVQIDIVGKKVIINKQNN